MATVTIGGRALEVRECSIGDWKDQIIPFEAAVAGLGLLAALEKTVALIHLFVGHNEGASIKWLENSLPFSLPKIREHLWQVLEAAGLKREPQPEIATGEASTQ